MYGCVLFVCLFLLLFCFVCFFLVCFSEGRWNSTSSVGDVKQQQSRSGRIYREREKEREREEEREIERERERERETETDRQTDREKRRDTAHARSFLSLCVVRIVNIFVCIVSI